MLNLQPVVTSFVSIAFIMMIMMMTIGTSGPNHSLIPPPICTSTAIISTLIQWNTREATIVQSL